MSVSIEIDFNKIDTSIQYLDGIVKDIKNSLNDFYRLQDNFKNYKGGTLFENYFITRKAIDSYGLEIEANRDWIRTFCKEVREASASLENMVVGISDDVSASTASTDATNNSFTDAYGINQEKVNSVFQSILMDTSEDNNSIDKTDIPSSSNIGTEVEHIIDSSSDDSSNNEVDIELSDISEKNSETNQELKINIDNSNEFSIDIPGDLGQYYTVTGYGKDGIWYPDGSTSFWASGTNQRQVFDIWKDAGGTYKNGIAVLNINGEDNYLVAVTETFGKAGDQITVSLDNGQKINCIIADIKSSSDSTWSQYGHLSEDGSYLNVLEFEVNMDKYLELNSNPSTDSWGLEWDSNSPVVNIVNNGSII
ncbi:MAG: hypothetical protein IKE73_03900 [Bacilli bacterium]|nr:hypothetical protein [Bacilli bacterium]